MIEQLLNPFYTWGRIPKWKRIEIINTYNEEEIRRILTNKNFCIDYSSFLLTPYWKTIKDIVKQIIVKFVVQKVIYIYIT